MNQEVQTQTPGTQAFILATLFGVLFLASVDNQLLIPLLPVLSDQFSVSLQRLGWLFSIYALSAGLFNLFLGPLTDRYGRIVFVRWGLALFMLLALATSQVDTFHQLLWLRGSTGLLAGLLSTCTASFVGDFFPYHRRGRIMGAILSSYFAALILGVPIGAWIAEIFGWRNVFLLSAVTAGVLWAVSFLSLPTDSGSRQPPRLSALRRYGGFLKGRQTSVSLFVSFMVSGGTLAFLTYIAGHLSEAFGLSPVEISSVFIIAGLASGLASPLSGWISDYWTKRSVFLWANSALALPLVVLPHLNWDVPLFLTLFLISLLIAFRQTALQTLQTQLISLKERGSYLALRNGFSQLGISFSVFVAGYIYDGPGYQGVVIWAAALTLLASFLLFGWVSEPDHELEPQSIMRDTRKEPHGLRDLDAKENKGTDTK